MNGGITSSDTPPHHFSVTKSTPRRALWKSRCPLPLCSTGIWGQLLPYQERFKGPVLTLPEEQGSTPLSCLLLVGLAQEGLPTHSPFPAETGRPRRLQQIQPGQHSGAFVVALEPW